MAQNINEVNREHARILAASCVRDSTRQNGLITIISLHQKMLYTILLQFNKRRKEKTWKSDPFSNCQTLLS